MSPAPANPLLEARVDSIDELFSRDPEGYGHGDGEELDQVIRALLRQREIWQKAEAEGAKRAPGAKAKAPAKSTKPAVTDLSDLGLDD